MWKSILIAMLALVIAAACSTPAVSYRENFSGFKAGDDKQAFCASVLKKNGILEECLHQLVVYERITNDCTDSVTGICITLNMNLWEQFTMNKLSLNESLAYNMGVTFDPVRIHKALLADASKFVVMCPGVGNKYAPCKAK